MRGEERRGGVGKELNNGNWKEKRRELNMNTIRMAADS